MPKGLVLFHRYDDGKRTAFEEHLTEAVHLNMPVEFTVNPEKEQLFKERHHRVAARYPVTVQYSYQSPSTDTIMLDQNGLPVRDAGGKLMFRPGGHGALIDNIARLDADMVFVKNIDNVQKDEYKHDTYDYYRILGGMMADFKERIFRLLHLLDQEPTGPELQRIVDEVTSLNIPLVDGFHDLPASHKRRYLHYKLNRPLRIAGMVINRTNAS